MKRIRRFGRELLGTNEGKLVKVLHAQVDCAINGTELAHQLVNGRVDSGEARRAMAEIEHAGDHHRARLVDALGRSLVTPFDREDLFRLSRSIDDVLDNLRDFTREYDLYGSPDGSPCAPVMVAIEDGLQRLREAIGHMIEQPTSLTQGALSAKKVGNQVRQEYQAAMAVLLDTDEVTSELLKQRELLRRLDLVGLRIGESADALADGAMKRSH